MYDTTSPIILRSEVVVSIVRNRFPTERCPGVTEAKIPKKVISSDRSYKAGGTCYSLQTPSNYNLANLTPKIRP